MALFNRLRNNNRHRSTVFEQFEDRRVLTTLAGYVFEDVNANSAHDIETEPGVPGVVVFLDANQNGQLDQAGFGLDPDEHSDGEVLNNASQLIFPSLDSSPNQSDSLVLAVRGTATSGNLVFGHGDLATWSGTNRLRFDFTLPVNAVSLDASGMSNDSASVARLDAYNSEGQLIQSDSSLELAEGEQARLSIQRDQNDIQYVVAHVENEGEVAFDNFWANNSADERSTLTSDTGSYFFFDEAENQSFTVAQQVAEGYVQTSPFPDMAHQTAVADDISGLNFGNRTNSIGGRVFNDAGVTGVYEPDVDEGISGAVLYLDVNGNSLPDSTVVNLNPGVFQDGEILDRVSEGIRLSVVGADSTVPTSERVTSNSDNLVSQDGQLFARDGEAAWDNEHRLRLDFDAPASIVEITFIAASETESEQGILVAYNSTGQAIASTTTQPLQSGEFERLRIERSGYDVAYAVAYTVSTTGQGRLDDISATVISEPVAATGATGRYLFKPLTDGNYRVSALPQASQVVTLPSDDNVRQVAVAEGSDELDVDFGLQSNNDAPVARADNVTTLEETLVAIGVLVNDFDPDGSVNEGSVTISQAPANGEAQVTPEGLINYTPDPDFFGTDTLLYTIRDDQSALSNSGTVTITVSPMNDAPRLVDDAVSVLRSTPTIINVLNNDVDIDGTIDVATVEIGQTPSGGLAVVDSATGNVTYTPTTGGNDTFTYTVKDNEGLVSNEATVTITARSTGTAPIAVDDAVSALEGTRQTLEVLANDSDPDGSLDIETITIVSPPGRGSVTLSDGAVNYTPILGFVGQDEFSYQVLDNDGIASNAATVTIDIAQRDFPFQNPINPLDVNPDGFIIPRDALIIINEINNRRRSDPTTGELTVNPEPGSLPAAYYDVNGDGFVAANDVLRVINFLNRQGNAEPAAEPADADMQAAAIAATFASNFDAFESPFDEDEEDA